MSNDFLSGLIVTLSLGIATFQLRYWVRSKDRLFLFFAVSFALMAVNRTALSIVADESETRTYLYVVRLIAFILIIVGIFDKNRRAKKETASSGRDARSSIAP